MKHVDAANIINLLLLCIFISACSGQAAQEKTKQVCRNPKIYEILVGLDSCYVSGFLSSPYHDGKRLTEYNSDFLLRDYPELNTVYQDATGRKWYTDVLKQIFANRQEIMQKWKNSISILSIGSINQDKLEVCFYNDDKGVIYRSIEGENDLIRMSADAQYIKNVRMLVQKKPRSFFEIGAGTPPFVFVSTISNAHWHSFVVQYYTPFRLIEDKNRPLFLSVDGFYMQKHIDSVIHWHDE